MTLNATICNATFSVDSVVAVNQFTWMDGNTYYASNTMATHVLTNIMGCDSLVMLSLHIEFVEIGIHAQWPNLVSQATLGTFQWVECPNYDIIPGATDSVFTPAQNGSYAVIVTKNGFIDTSDCVHVNNVGIGEVNLSNHINIYPNPFHDQVNIEITNWPTHGVEIGIRDILGKLIHMQKIELIANNETIKINTSKWAKGTYFVEIGQDENRVVEKIVVQ